MNKVLTAFLVIISMTLYSSENNPDFNFSINWKAVGQFIRNSNDRLNKQAQKRLARDKAIKEAARLNVHKEQIMKEELESLKLILVSAWWLISNGFKLSVNTLKYALETTKDTSTVALELLQDAESVAIKLKAFDKRTIRGSLGLATITALILYKYYTKKSTIKPADDYKRAPGCNPNADPNNKPDLDREFQAFQDEQIEGYPNSNSPEQQIEGQPYVPGGFN